MLCLESLPVFFIHAFLKLLSYFRLLPTAYCLLPTSAFSKPLSPPAFQSFQNLYFQLIILRVV
jgi:hypothetical protein